MNCQSTWVVYGNNPYLNVPTSMFKYFCKKATFDDVLIADVVVQSAQVGRDRKRDCLTKIDSMPHDTLNNIFFASAALLSPLSLLILIKYSSPHM